MASKRASPSKSSSRKAADTTRQRREYSTVGSVPQLQSEDLPKEINSDISSNDELSQHGPKLPTTISATSLRQLDVSSQGLKAKSSSQSSISSSASSALEQQIYQPIARRQDTELIRSSNPYEDDDTSSLESTKPPRHPANTASNTHLTTFAPPFYNRPPAPLPPSPSLTSLLRPSFSTRPSRPTTPDDYFEAEPLSRIPSTTTTGTDVNQAALLNTARTAQPLPRASPKVPTYEYYGFVLYLTSSLCFLGYVLWSYLPSPFLHRLGIDYYPDRWWSLAIPAWIVMAVGFVYVALAGYNSEIMTLPLGSLGTVVDEVGVVAVVDERTGRIIGKGTRQGREHDELQDWDWRDCWNESTDAVLDVPIGGVCEILYADG